MTTDPNYSTDTAKSSRKPARSGSYTRIHHNFEAANWTAQMVDKLRELWTGTKLSASLIGDEIGVSRSAVLSKRRRLNLPGRVQGGKRKKGIEGRKRTRNLSVRNRPKAKPKPPPPSSAPTLAPVTFFALERGMCRYPLDHGFFCGAATDDDSFCPWHAAKCRMPS